MVCPFNGNVEIVCYIIVLLSREKVVDVGDLPINMFSVYYLSCLKLFEKETNIYRTL